MKSTILKNATPLVSLAFCSFVLLLATIPWVGRNVFYWESIFAIAVTIITIAVVGFLFYKHQRNSDVPGASFHVVVFLAIMWIFTAGIVTFRGPFLITGNGYFSAWAGAIFAVVAAKEVHSDDGIAEVIEPSPAPPQPRLVTHSPAPDDGTASRTAMVTMASA